MLHSAYFRYSASRAYVVCWYRQHQEIAGAGNRKVFRGFLPKLGHDVADELVDWFNTVDATYRSDFRHLFDGRFATLDARLEQRFAALEAKIDKSVAALEAKFEQSTAALDAKIDQSIAALEAKFEQSIAALDAKFNQRIVELEARFNRSSWLAARS